MLVKKIQQLLSLHGQALVSSIDFLCRKPIANMTTVLVIAIALALPALFWVCADNLRLLTKEWQHNGHISIYLKPNTPDAEQKQTLANILATAGVGQATLKSSNQGLDELVKQEGMQDIMHYLPENPLPSVIDVLPAVSIDSPAKLDLLARQLELINSVDMVKLDMEWIRRLHVMLDFAARGAQILFSLLALAVVLIIGNTLRLAIQSRQEEIQILKLIGATNPYILRPFLYSGIWYGLLGALVAVFLVNIFILSLRSAMNQLLVMYQMHSPLSGLSLRQILLLVLVAVILGWLGACLSVRRQLAAIEPFN